MTWHVVCRARTCRFEHRVEHDDPALEEDLAAELAHGHHAATDHIVAWGRIDAEAPRRMPAVAQEEG